jgi:hypothetical protein
MVTFGVAPKPPLTVTPEDELVAEPLCEALSDAVADLSELEEQAVTMVVRAAAATTSAATRREG